MYLYFDIEEVEQKQLFFMLSNALSLSYEVSGVGTGKISGVYAIYKNGICQYVGQSTNIPSRLATHLRGKYSDCDKINIFTPTQHSFADFYERDSESRKEILLNNEKAVIAKLKPVENIIADMDFTIEDEFLFCSVTGIGGDNDPSEIEILVSSTSLTVIDTPACVPVFEYIKGRMNTHFDDECAINEYMGDDIILSTENYDITYKRKVNNG